MADEDEIDILGDFSLNIFSSRTDTNTYDNPLVSEDTDLLKCDYTIHPQWLLDRPSANPDNWYNTNISSSLSQSDNDVLGLICTQNSINDESGWTEKEKSLLERGIEIFGKSNDRLSQFVGSKTSSEVKYYLKNFYFEHQTNTNLNENILEHSINTSLVTDVLDDNQIPASVEEVIATVSTAKPTIQTYSHKRQKKGCSNRDDEKKCFSSSRPLTKFHLDKTDSFSKQMNYQERNNVQRGKKMTIVKPSKFREKVKMKMSSCVSSRGIKQKLVKISNEKSSQSVIKKAVITTGQGLFVPICEGEEIVKLKSASEDSDTDIDIDVEFSDEGTKTNEFNKKKFQAESDEPYVKEHPGTKIILNNSEIRSDHSIPSREFTDYTKLSESLQKKLKTLEEPSVELELDFESITELEKVVHSEYFDVGTTKTPERYLKIRNHILSGWMKQKPNYLFKTSSRQGLKNCGDVNSFGRIHNFLEQIGAINFGCDQVVYYRPLIDMVHEYASIKEKKNDLKVLDASLNKLGGRERFKKKFVNDGEGGYTLSHGENGQIIKNTVVNNEEPSGKHKVYIRKPTVRLIYCRPFNKDFQQPYTLKMNLSTLLLMDFHSHASLTEVMGLVAGYWISRKKILTVTGYEPCRNVASSATHCDMCPISQASASDVIHKKGLDIVGWFHSHPTFAPEPSQQDLDTQRSVQQWIGQNKPCIAVILSPFNLNGALIASPMRCLVVDRKVNFDDQFVPYKFKVDVEFEDFDLEAFLSDFQKVLKWNLVTNADRMVKFGQPYFQDQSITFLEKYITSVRMNLAKCGILDKSICNNIIQGITDICSKTNKEQKSL